MDLAQFLFTVPDVKAFLSNKLCQDPLEKFFGQQSVGVSMKTPKDFIKNTQALRVVHGVCRNIKGNCRGNSSDSNMTIYTELSEPLPKRRKTNTSLPN